MGNERHTMTMAIIAAGEGSRLKQEGVETPKALIPIGGVPMIERLMRMAVRHGVTRIHAIVNAESETVRAFLEQQRNNLPLTLVVKSTPSSMHSLFELAPLVSDGPFLLSTVDSIFRESEFNDYLDAVRRCEADGMLAITHFIDDEKPLCVVTDTEGRVLQFSDTAEGCDTATGGLYWFTPRIFDAMPDALEARMERLRNFLRLLLQRSYDLRTFRFTKMIDVDHRTDIEKAEAFAADDAAGRVGGMRMHR